MKFKPEDNRGFLKQRGGIVINLAGMWSGDKYCRCRPGADTSVLGILINYFRMLTSGVEKRGMTVCNNSINTIGLAEKKQI